MNRSETRDLAFKLLYQNEIQKEFSKENIELFFENNNIEDEVAVKYITEVAEGIEENREEIDVLICRNLKEDWKIERISKINLALLRLAIYEINYVKLPYKVVINEVVELAKKYGEETSKTFINGVLASVVKENI